MMIALCCLTIYLANWSICGHLQQIKANHNHYPNYENRVVTRQLRKLHVEYFKNRLRPPGSLGVRANKFKWLCGQISKAVAASRYIFDKTRNTELFLQREYLRLTVDQIKMDLVDDLHECFRCTLHFNDAEKPHNIFLIEGPPSSRCPPLSGCFVALNQEVEGYKNSMLVLADYILYSKERVELIYDTDLAISLAYPEPPIMSLDPIQVEREFLQIIQSEPKFQIKFDGTARQDTVQLPTEDKVGQQAETTNTERSDVTDGFQSINLEARSGYYDQRPMTEENNLRFKFKLPTPKKKASDFTQGTASDSGSTGKQKPNQSENERRQKSRWDQT